MKFCALCGNLLELNFFSNSCVVGDSKTMNFFGGFLGMICSYKHYILWIRQEKPRFRTLVKNNLIFECIFFLLARGAVGVLFSTFWRNVYCFLMVVTGSKCLVDIWKRVHKKSEASDAFSAWCFFGLSEVAFFSSSLFVSSNFSCI